MMPQNVLVLYQFPTRKSAQDPERIAMRRGFATNFQAAAGITSLLVTLSGIAAAAPLCDPAAAQSARWIGNGVLAGGKGYVATPMGQVHYRLIGPPNAPVILLLHQTPWSLVEFAGVQECLAAQNVRSLAVETPGYGMSDPPPGKPTIADYADNLLPVLDALKFDRVVVAGHHTGAAIAAALAARRPDRVVGVILHGTPLYTDAERAQRLSAPEQRFTLKADGDHLSDYFRHIKPFAGNEPHALVSTNWSVLNRYEAGVNDIAHTAVFRNDMARDLAAIRVPVLILLDALDSLHAMDLRAAKQYAAFRYRQFSDGTAHMMMGHPDRWAAMAAEFMASVEPPTP
jgi:pimeloyl-ACP methyl ester carboxylesterase